MYLRKVPLVFSVKGQPDSEAVRAEVKGRARGEHKDRAKVSWRGRGQTKNAVLERHWSLNGSGDSESFNVCSAGVTFRINNIVFHTAKLLIPLLFRPYSLSTPHCFLKVKVMLIMMERTISMSLSS